MDERKVLSVQELATQEGKSIQSIYKRIRNKNDIIQNFLQRDNEGNIIEPYMIYADGVDIIYKKNRLNYQTNTKPTEPGLVEFRQQEEKQESKQEQNACIKAIEALQEQLKVLQDELKEAREDKQRKDELIFQLNERLEESQSNLERQQKLQALDRKRIQELEASHATPFRRLLNVFKRPKVTEMNWK